jgi:hypothetical protein
MTQTLYAHMNIIKKRKVSCFLSTNSKIARKEIMKTFPTTIAKPQAK